MNGAGFQVDFGVVDAPFGSTAVLPGPESCPGTAQSPCGGRQSGACGYNGACLCNSDHFGEGCQGPALLCPDSPICAMIGKSGVVSVAPPPYGSDATGIGSLGDGSKVSPKSYGSIAYSLAQSKSGDVIVLMAGAYPAGNCGASLVGNVSMQSATGSSATSINCTSSVSAISGRRQTAIAVPNFVLNGTVTLSGVNLVGVGIDVVGGIVTLTDVVVEGALSGAALWIAPGVSVTIVSCSFSAVVAPGTHFGVDIGMSASLLYAGSNIINLVMHDADGSAVRMSDGALLGLAAASLRLAAAVRGSPTSLVLSGSGTHGGCVRASGTVSVERVEFAQCNATGSGGAVSVDGGKMTLLGVTISSCSAKIGGAAYVAPGAWLDLVTTSILACRAVYGGGVAGDGNATVTATGSDIAYCSATVGGGGVQLADGATALGVVVRGCDAGKLGGGVLVLRGGTLSGAVVTSNIAHVAGGGIAFISAGHIGGSTVPLNTISGTAIRGNSCPTGCGGAMFISDGTLDLTSAGVTLAQNTAQYGAAIGVNGTSVVIGARVAQHTASIGGGAFGILARSTVELDACAADSCSADAGGAVWIADGASVVVRDLAVLQCSAAGDGGGAWVGRGASLSGTSLIRGGSARRGGGIACVACLLVSGAAVRDSTATESGGCIAFVTAVGFASPPSTTTTHLAANLTVSNCWSGGSGGCVVASGTALRVSNVTVLSCSAALGGGCLAAYAAQVENIGTTVATLSVCSAQVGGNILLSGAGAAVIGFYATDGRAAVCGGAAAAIGCTNCMLAHTIAANAASQQTAGGICALDSSRGVSLVLDNVTVRNATATIGGCLHVANATVVVRAGSGAQLENGTALRGGCASIGQDGIISGPAGSLRAFSCAAAEAGGALAFTGDGTVAGLAAVGAVSPQGATVYVGDGVTARLLRCALVGGRGSNGAGVFVGLSATLRVGEHTNVTDCIAGAANALFGAGRGAGIFLSLGSTALLDGAVLQDNVALNDGGALYVSAGARALLSNTVLINNTAALAGGGACLEYAASASIVGSTLSGNRAQQGGHVYTLSGMSIIGSQLRGVPPGSARSAYAADGAYRSKSAPPAYVCDAAAGSAVYADIASSAAGVLNIVNTSMQYLVSPDGGVIVLNRGSAHVRGVVISDCFGSALIVSSDVTAENVTISRVSARFNGGGLVLQRSGIAVLNDSILEGTHSTCMLTHADAYYFVWGKSRLRMMHAPPPPVTQVAAHKKAQPSSLTAAAHSPPPTRYSATISRVTAAEPCMCRYDCVFFGVGHVMLAITV